MPDVDRPQVYNAGSESDTDPEVREISLPSGPLPGHGPRNGDEALPAINVESKTTYSSKPVLRDFIKEAAVMVPSVMQRKKQQPSVVPSVIKTGETSEQHVEATNSTNGEAASASSRQPVLEDYHSGDEYDNTESMYAPEEEEYMRAQGMKRKLDEEDDI